MEAQEKLRNHLAARTLSSLAAEAKSNKRAYNDLIGTRDLSSTATD
jgi:hypothetical protein